MTKQLQQWGKSDNHKDRHDNNNKSPGWADPTFKSRNELVEKNGENKSFQKD